MPDLSLQDAKASLEHFALIEDVLIYIRKKLGTETHPDAWKQVCEDILHCELPKIEPHLLHALADTKGQLVEEQKIRGLLRAVSWFTHPAKTIEELITILGHLKETHPREEDQAHLDLVHDALEKKKEGAEAHPAAEAIDVLFSHAHDEAERVHLRELRDQIAYQLLYPHWFEVVKRWTEAHERGT